MALIKFRPRFFLAILAMFLFLLSGNFALNRIEYFQGVGLEMRWFFLVLLIFCVPFVSGRGGDKNYWWPWISAGLWVWVVITLAGVMYTDRPFDGIRYFFDLVLILFVAWYANNLFEKFGIESVFWLGAFFALAALLYSLVVILSSQLGGGRGSIGIGGPNVATRVMFFGGLFLLFFAVYKRKGLFPYLLGSGVCFLGVILVGSRGGVVAALISLSMLLAGYSLSVFFKATVRGSLNRRNVASLIKTFPFFVVSVTGLIYFGWSVFFDRVVQLVIMRFHWSGRDEIYADTIDGILSSPFIGQGVASYKSFVNYPHNIVLEVMHNSGVFGLSVFVYFVVLSFYVFFKLSGAYKILGVLPLYMVLVQMLSGEIYDFRYFFVFLVASFFLLSFQQRNLRSVGCRCS